MALYTKFSVQRALLLKGEDLEVLEGLQSHLESYVKAQSSGSLYRPISTEGFKSLNKLEGWSAFAQISLFKTTTLFSSTTGNIYILSTCLMPHEFCSCQPPKAPLLRVRVWQSCWEDGEHQPGLYRCHFPASEGGQALEQVPAGPYLSNAIFLISPSGITNISVLPWKVGQTEPFLSKTPRQKFHPLLHIPVKPPWGQGSAQCTGFGQLQQGFR